MATQRRYGNTKIKIKILVIEDNLGDANLVRIYMKKAGIKYELFHAETFYEGVELAEDNNIDLVLLDLSLPDSQGFKTLTNFLNKFPKLPVIVMTGLNDEVVGNQSVKAGAQDFLVKGQFDDNLLGRVIRYSIQRHKTQLKLEQYAKSLAISEKRYIEAQEMAHFGNWEMDIVTNEMKWTDEVYRIFGFHPQSISPTLSDYLGLVHIEDRQIVEEAFSQVIKDGQLHKVEYRIIVDGRRIKHIANQLKIFYDDITEKILLVGAIQDITEQKVSQQLIIEKNLSERSSKVKEEILEDMSFHIRTPLSSLVNLTYLMEESDGTGQSENLDGLKESVGDLSVAVNNLLNFSILLSEKVKLENTHFKVENLIKSVRQVVKLKADKKNITLDFKVFDNVPDTLIGDINKINQVLFNLVDNAIKFSKDGSTVRLKIICSDPKSDNIKLYLVVEDDGVGISSTKIDELLEADKLLKVIYDQDNKTGLGLAIVNKLVKTLKGGLEIESTIGQGSQFKVELPIKVAITKRRYTAEKPEAPLRILLVEDHFLNQLATKKVLTKWSSYVSVDIAENGLVGFEKFRAHNYDLILMDLQMPVMTGFESVEKIREYDTKIPIIALTANSSSQEAEKATSMGMNDYLAKPFNPQDLYLKIMGSISDN